MEAESTDRWGGVGPINVTARELSRDTRALLDRVCEGRTLVVIRGSRVVARVEPVDDDWNYSLPPSAQVARVRDEQMPAELPEDEPQREILRAYSDGQMVFIDRPDLRHLSISTKALAMTRLELMGLMQRVGGGYRITREGHRVVKWMEREETAGSNSTQPAESEPAESEPAPAESEPADPGGL